MKKKKYEHIAETYCYQSPNQIGAAVLSYARHIMNLIMFNYSPNTQTYTDTDSITLSENNVDELKSLNLIDSSATAPLGTLKNDHAEDNGTEPRIFLSMIGGKKVKLHFTINQEGDIKLFNTFKGFNPATFVGNKKLYPIYADYLASKALFEINIKGTGSTTTVTSWKKTPAGGVRIENHLQTMDSETYISHSRGIGIVNTGFGNKFECFVPWGSKRLITYPSTCDKEKPAEQQWYYHGRVKKTIENNIYRGLQIWEMNLFIENYYYNIFKNEMLQRIKVNEDDEEARETLEKYKNIKKQIEIDIREDEKQKLRSLDNEFNSFDTQNWMAEAFENIEYCPSVKTKKESEEYHHVLSVLEKY